jgi:hypothetical protein
MRFFLAAFLVIASAAARAEDATRILEKYDQTMGPKYYESDLSMTAHRADGTSRTYEMKVWKSEDDKFRGLFNAPAAARGQEVLRVGDNFWVYMPNLKRAVRLAARDSFMGGDFNNADVLRSNYSVDYTATIAKDEKDHWVLELKSKNPSSAYDRIVLSLRKKDYTPIEGHFYAVSGKELRAAEFLDVKDFHGHRRPSRIVMKNMVETAKRSEMTVKEMKVLPSIPATRFVLTELGK